MSDVYTGLALIAGALIAWPAIAELIRRNP